MGDSDVRFKTCDVAMLRAKAWGNGYTCAFLVMYVYDSTVESQCKRSHYKRCLTTRDEIFCSESFV